MGDLLRRVLYPFFLPAIVFAVWANAWSAKLDRVPRRMPPIPPAAFSNSPPPPRAAPHTGYGLQRDDEGFASAADDDGN